MYSNALVNYFHPAYPPDGIMPTTTVGSFSGPLAVSATASPNSILYGTNAILTGSALGGTPPYTYQWYEEAPGVSSYSSISGATSNTYTFSTTSSTPAGQYSFIFQAKDSASSIANSIPVNVLVSAQSTLAYVPITITNTQNSPTPAPFQQMLTINSLAYSAYINSGWTNVEFSSSAPVGSNAPSTGSLLNAWLESGNSNTATNTVVWVNLPNSIAANSNTVIYMNFMQSNVMSSSGPTGEAPQLSSTYAEYDNGANVFNYYQRWGGLSALPTNWETIGNSGQTPVVTFNSIYTNIEPTSTVAWQGVALPSAYYPSSFSAGNVIDMYGEIYQGSTVNSQPIVGFDGWSGPGTNFDTLMFGAMGYGPTLSSSPTYGIGVSGYSNWGSTGLTETTNNQVYSLSYLSAASFGMQVNYANPVIETVGSQANPNNYFLFGVAYIGDIANVYWLRTRAYPPNGVMPSASFSSLS
jgi:hypothetical protein